MPVRRTVAHAIDEAGNLVAEQRVLVALLWPEQLADRVVERAHAPLDRRAHLEPAHRVVQQERRGGPETDERRWPRVATPAGRHLEGARFAGVWVIPEHLAHRRQ